MDIEFEVDMAGTCAQNAQLHSQRNEETESSIHCDHRHGLKTHMFGP